MLRFLPAFAFSRLNTSSMSASSLSSFLRSVTIASPSIASLSKSSASGGSDFLSSMCLKNSSLLNMLLSLLSIALFKHYLQVAFSVLNIALHFIHVISRHFNYLRVAFILQEKQLHANTLLFTQIAKSFLQQGILLFASV